METSIRNRIKRNRRRLAISKIIDIGTSGNYFAIIY